MWIALDKNEMCLEWVNHGTNYYTHCRAVAPVRGDIWQTPTGAWSGVCTAGAYSASKYGGFATAEEAKRTVKFWMDVALLALGMQ